MRRADIYTVSILFRVETHTRFCLQVRREHKSFIFKLVARSYRHLRLAFFSFQNYLKSDETIKAVSQAEKYSCK